MINKQTPVKSNLFKLKKWLTVPDAARHLSITLEEEVSEADVLRLALDGHLKLSVYFVNHTQARCGKVVPYEDVKWTESSLLGFMQSGKHIPEKAKGNPQETRKFIDQVPPLTYMKSLNLGGERFLNLDENVTSIHGVWDLSMIGNEWLDVEHKYQMLTGGPEVTIETLDGAFVEREDVGMCLLQESYDKNEYQSGSAAQLEKIKEHIASNNIEEERAKELLSQHKKNREKYLKERIKNNYAGDYYPAGGLPADSVLVVRTQALIDLKEKLYPEKSMKGKSLEAPADYEAEQPEQSNSDLSSRRVSTDETSEIRDPDTFIRSLQVSYVNDTEIRISGGDKNAKTYGMKELGFAKENSKVWNEFRRILESTDHSYYVGKARGAKRAKKASYDVAQKVLVQINKKLIPFLNENYQAQLPEGFKVYEKLKTDKPGLYRFKFKIKKHGDDDTERFKELSKDKLISEIEELSEQLEKLRNIGNAESDSLAYKIEDQLNAAVDIASKREWIGKNRAWSYLHPEDDPPYVEPSIKDEDSIQED